jgi:hypothetical protein
MNEEALAHWGLSRQNHKNKDASMVWNERSLPLLVSGRQDGFRALGLIWQQQVQQFPPSFYMTSVTNSALRVLLVRHFQLSFLCRISPCSTHVLYRVP